MSIAAEFYPNFMFNDFHQQVLKENIEAYAAVDDNKTFIHLP